MNKGTFQHGKFYKITKHGRINPDFLTSGRRPITLNGDGESVWFVGLAWRTGKNNSRFPFYLIASNFYRTEKLYIEYDENSLRKRDRVKTIEPFTLKEFPLLIEAKTTTLFSRLLKNEISVKALKKATQVFKSFSENRII